MGQQRRGAAIDDAGRGMRPGDDVTRPTGRRTVGNEDGAGYGNRRAVDAGRAIEDTEGLGIRDGSADLRPDADDAAGRTRRDLAFGGLDDLPHLLRGSWRKRQQRSSGSRDEK